jgi:hypothetical protein
MARQRSLLRANRQSHLGRDRRHPQSVGCRIEMKAFSVAPMTSVRVWIDGIVFSIVFGWISAVVLGPVYNYLVRG